MKPGTMKGIIHTDDDCYDLIYWSIKFGVSIEQLVQAVAEVGPLVMNVERHLGPSTAAMADPSAANPDRYVRSSTASGPLVNGWIFQHDPTAFLVRNDKGRCGVAKAHETQTGK